MIDSNQAPDDDPSPRPFTSAAAKALWLHKVPARGANNLQKRLWVALSDTFDHNV